MSVNKIEKLENNEGKDFNEFRDYGYKMVDYICKYMENIKDRPVTTTKEPGFMAPTLESELKEQFSIAVHQVLIP